MLAAVVLFSTQSAREQGRDTKRVADISQLQIALRLFAEQNDRYPSGVDGVCDHFNSFSDIGCLQALVTQGFISELPSDPQETAYTGAWSTSWMYFYDNWCDGGGGRQDTQYRLWSNAETNQSSAPKWWSDTIVGATNCNDPI